MMKRSHSMTICHSRRLGNARPLFLLLLVTTGLLPIASNLPSRAQKAKAAVTPAQRAAAVAGAQGAVRKMAQVKTIPQAADLLTNKSAATMGALFTLIAGMAVSFPPAPGANHAPGTSPAKLQRDLSALMARWGIRENNQGKVEGKNGADLPPLVVKNGRRYLVDIGTFMDKVDPKHKTSFRSTLARSVSDFTYTVLSPTRVRLTSKRAGKPQTPAEAMSEPTAAVFEDGRWRLDMGDMAGKSSRTTGPAAKSAR